MNDRVHRDAAGEVDADLPRLIETKREELADLRQKLPAHSVRPHQLIEIEDLEDEVAALEARLRAAGGAEADVGA